ncbi:hypothetical protein AKJ09_01796 [Labilithrix luteola]|uniref:Uncharacterized protein n=1 Tax=Labilithrix luteola TaxID=1391654 RepID=A0A0K1PNN5_9BACT|nr:hypothetical protein AKJ09_01796 [Labilithrix luteola]
MIFGVWAVAALAFALLCWNAMRSSSSALAAELARRGIRYQGLSAQGTASPAAQTALDRPLNGILLERSDGIRASISSNPSQGAATLPGFGPVYPQHTLVEVPVALPDQLICAPDRAQVAFGPFSPPPVRTANPHFDQRFGVYVRPEDGHVHRTTPPDAVPWAHSPAAATLFANFDTLGFVAMHVQGGQARILFAPMAVDGLVAAIDTAALLAHPHEGRRPAHRSSPTWQGRAAPIMLCVLGFVPMVIGLPMLSYATEAGVEVAGSDVACPNGGVFKGRFRNNPAKCTLPDGTSYWADEGAFTAWRFALSAPYALAVAAAAAALYFKRRGETLRVVHRNLTS